MFTKCSFNQKKKRKEKHIFFIKSECFAIYILISKHFVSINLTWFHSTKSVLLELEKILWNNIIIFMFPFYSNRMYFHLIIHVPRTLNDLFWTEILQNCSH